MNRRPLPALPPAPRKRRARPGREGRAAALFLLPSLLGTAVFVLLPFAETAGSSRSLNWQ